MAIYGSLEDFSEPARLIKVDETTLEPTWNWLMRGCHYLGCESMVGRRVKYIVGLGEKLSAP